MDRDRRPRSPRSANPVRVSIEIDIEAGRQFWAYQPPALHAAPAIADTAWPSGEIDRFLLGGLEARGLRPVDDADRVTLARRLWFDLIGLPPSPEEVDDFDSDPAPMPTSAGSIDSSPPRISASVGGGTGSMSSGSPSRSPSAGSSSRKPGAIAIT